MHMVIYRSVEGQSVFHQVESLEDAARHVETLRNAGQGNDARIFAMNEVKIEVKTYYRVEVAKADEVAKAPSAESPPSPLPSESAAPAAAPAAPVAPTPAPAPSAAPSVSPAPTSAPANASAPSAVKPEPAVAGANGGRFGLFGKS